MSTEAPIITKPLAGFFTSTFSNRTFPDSEKCVIPSYGPVSIAEANDNPAIFSKCFDEPALGFYHISSLRIGRTGTNNKAVYVSPNCTWHKNEDNEFIDPVYEMTAINRRGATVYIHVLQRNYCYTCAETSNVYTSSSSVYRIEDTGKCVSKTWMNNDHDGSKYFCCQDCGNWYSRDNEHPDYEDVCRGCGDDRDSDDDDDDESSSLIDDYGSERYPAHRGKHPRKYGVEMEVEVRGSMDERARTVLNKCKDSQGKFVILKSDGSLDRGFEIVSAPMDFNTHMTAWADYFQTGTAGLTAWDTGTCGLHIHVTRAELSHLQLGKMIVFVNDPKHCEFIQLIAGRDPARWAAFRPNWKHGKSRSRDGERYSAINLGNDDTIEFRIFRGTVKAATFYKALQFVDALIEYCGPCNRGVMETNNLDNFLSYVRKHRKIYPHLDDFLVSKNRLPARKVAKNKTAELVASE